MSYDYESQGMLAFAIAMSTGSSSEGLETVEKLEQNRARNNCMLPIEMEPCRETFEALGFTFEDVDDDVLYQATLPEGWAVKSDGGYWSYLIDEKGRERGSYFYKGAFYDRNGHMSLRQRFSVTSCNIDSDNWESPVKVLVKDIDGTILFDAGQCKKSYTNEYYELVKKAEEYLKANYPDWEDASKYWD